MGHSRAGRDESHDRILRVAAARFRERGVDGVGVADLMKEAGLTHGGFYRHFSSRDDLVAAAVERALRDGGRAVAAVVSDVDEGAFAGLVEAYLSVKHRDDLATSCAVTTLAADVARSTVRARSAYARQVTTYLDLLTKLLAGSPVRARRAKAILALSALVGAVSIARAVNDESLSREILEATTHELEARFARKPAPAGRASTTRPGRGKR